MRLGTKIVAEDAGPKCTAVLKLGAVSSSIIGLLNSSSAIQNAAFGSTCKRNGAVAVGSNSAQMITLSSSVLLLRRRTLPMLLRLRVRSRSALLRRLMRRCRS